MTIFAVISEEEVSHGKVLTLDKGLTLTETTIASVLEDGAEITLLFEDGSVLGPTVKSEIVVKTTARLAAVIIKDSSAFDGQWQLGSAYTADQDHKITLKMQSEKISWRDGKTTWTDNLILELKHPETQPREIYLHRVAIPEFVEGSPPASNRLDAFLAVISDRNEISHSLNQSKGFLGTAIGYGPVEVDLEFNIESLSLDGTFKLA